MTDDDFKEVIDISIKDEKYIKKMIKETNNVKKRSKASFMGTQTAQNEDLPTTNNMS